MSSALGQNKKLRRGINIANALEAPKEGDWGIIIENRYFQIIKEQGFCAVRIPIRWSTHSLSVYPFTISGDFFKRVDNIIEGALGSNLSIIINIHHFSELFLSPIKNTEWFLSLWKQIAERYKDYSDNLYFELLNEPHYRLNINKWNALLKKAISIIRNSNSTRTILVGAAKWNKINGLKYLELPNDDNNIIVTFHYYSPIIFTHQGAEWIKFSNLFLGRKWSGSQKQLNKVEVDFKFVNDWSLKSRVPINLGEFGTYKKADSNSRILWTTHVARTAEKYNFSWLYWDFGAGFGVYNPTSQQWNLSILNSLITSNKGQKRT